MPKRRQARLGAHITNKAIWTRCSSRGILQTLQRERVVDYDRKDIQNSTTTMGEVEVKINPANKRLLIEVVEETAKEVETRSFILPEDAKPPSEYTRAVVTAIAQDVESPAGLEVGHEIIILTHMIEKVVIGNEEIIMVPANYVMCIITGS